MKVHCEDSSCSAIFALVLEGDSHHFGSAASENCQPGACAVGAGGGGI